MIKAHGTQAQLSTLLRHLYRHTTTINKSNNNRKTISFTIFQKKKIKKIKIMLSTGCSMYLFHHVFLPPKIPQKNDFQPEYGHLFFDVVERALLTFGEYSEPLPQKSLDAVTQMVARMRSVHDQSTGDVIGSTLVTTLGDLVKHGMSSPLDKRSMLIIFLSRRLRSSFHSIAECWHLDKQNQQKRPF